MSFNLVFDLLLVLDFYLPLTCIFILLAINSVLNWFLSAFSLLLCLLFAYSSNGSFPINISNFDSQACQFWILIISLRILPFPFPLSILLHINAFNQIPLITRFWAGFQGFENIEYLFHHLINGELSTRNQIMILNLYDLFSSSDSHSASDLYLIMISSKCFGFDHNAPKVL